MSDPFEVSKKNITQTELERRRAGRQKRQGRAVAGAGGAAAAVGGGLMAQAAQDEPRLARESRAFLGGATRQAVKGNRAAARTLAGRAVLHSPSTVVGAGLAAGGATAAAGGLGWMGAGAARGRKKESDLRRKRKAREQSMSKAADPFEVEIAKLNAAGIGNLVGGARRVRRKGLVGASKTRRAWRGMGDVQRAGVIGGGALAGGGAAGVGVAEMRKAALPPGPKGAKAAAGAAKRAARNQKLRQAVRDASGVARTKAQSAKDAAMGGPRRAFTEETSDFVRTPSGRNVLVDGVRVGTRRPGNRFVRPSERYQEFANSGQKLSGVRRSGGGPRRPDVPEGVGAGLAAGGATAGLIAVPVAAGVAWDKAEQKKKEKSVSKAADPFEISKAKARPQDVNSQVVRDSKTKGAIIGGIAGLPIAGPVGAIPGAGIGYVVGGKAGNKRVRRLTAGEGTDKDKLAQAKARAKVRARLEQAEAIGKSADPFEISSLSKAEASWKKAALYNPDMTGHDKRAIKNRALLDEHSEKVPKVAGAGAVGGALAGGAAGAVLARRMGGGRLVNPATGETVRRVAGTARQVRSGAGWGGLTGAYLGGASGAIAAGTKAGMEVQRDPRYKERPKKKKG